MTEALPTWDILVGDCREVLANMPEQSAQTCVTSPPYFGLRDYGHDGQIGLEDTPEAFVAAMVDVFRGVWRVLRDDGTLWLNLGDSYARQGGAGAGGSFDAERPGWHPRTWRGEQSPPSGCKAKDLIGIPWMVAFALRADGWYLRSEIIWHKPNPMPESVTDRPTKAHEQIFLLTKGSRYVYDADAVAETAAVGNHPRTVFDNGPQQVPPGTPPHSGIRHFDKSTRNKRTVWTVPTHPYRGAHFATFPPKLIEPCILAGAPVGATVLDPFNGAGTTGMVALRHHRSYVGIELNPDYADISRERIRGDSPLLNAASEAA